jgi:hypothetical protein
MWFWIDLISIFPFDDFVKLISHAGEAVGAPDNSIAGNKGNMLVRTIKVGKIGKLIRLMRLVKVFKILKNKQNMSSHFSKSLEIDAGTERLVFCGAVFFFMNHVFSCLWVLIGDSEIDRASWYTNEIQTLDGWE